MIIKILLTKGLADKAGPFHAQKSESLGGVWAHRELDAGTRPGAGAFSATGKYIRPELIRRGDNVQSCHKRIFLLTV